MGTQLVEKGTMKGEANYLIYNIDDIFTVYIEIEKKINPISGASEPVYSAVKSFRTLAEAKLYIATLSK